MLPQFGFTEFLLLSITALIVIGPKDLPVLMRQLGQFVARGRAMAREFMSAFDDIARESELEALRQEIQSLKRDNALSQAVDDLKQIEQDINKDVMAMDDVSLSGAETETESGREKEVSLSDKEQAKDT